MWVDFGCVWVPYPVHTHPTKRDVCGVVVSMPHFLVVSTRGIVIHRVECGKCGHFSAGVFPDRDNDSCFNGCFVNRVGEWITPRY